MAIISTGQWSFYGLEAKVFGCESLRGCLFYFTAWTTFGYCACAENSGNTQPVVIRMCAERSSNMAVRPLNGREDLQFCLVRGSGLVEESLFTCRRLQVQPSGSPVKNDQREDGMKVPCLRAWRGTATFSRPYWTWGTNDPTQSKAQKLIGFSFLSHDSDIIRLPALATQWATFCCLRLKGSPGSGRVEHCHKRSKLKSHLHEFQLSPVNFQGAY